MKYIYGPVKSRRLGLSLGLSLTPHKVCNLDCLYCQLGRTTQKTGERKEYFKGEEVLEELKFWLSSHPREAGELGYVTLSGSGEPTLNIKIGAVIEGIRKQTSARIAVITNAVSLGNPEVRQAIMGADLIVPSLDAAEQDIFDKIDRPYAQIKIEDVISGLEALRKEFKGKIWLEVMLVRGINDSPEHIRKLKEAIDRIGPDRIQLNSPVRTTAEKDILPVDAKKLGQIKEILGGKAEIV